MSIFARKYCISGKRDDGDYFFAADSRCENLQNGSNTEGSDISLYYCCKEVLNVFMKGERLLLLLYTGKCITVMSLFSSCLDAKEC